MVGELKSLSSRSKLALHYSDMHFLMGVYFMQIECFQIYSKAQH